jgi:hypothetical protein
MISVEDAVAQPGIDGARVGRAVARPGNNGLGWGLNSQIGFGFGEGDQGFLPATEASLIRGDCAD